MALGCPLYLEHRESQMDSTVLQKKLTKICVQYSREVMIR
jgi:hypothetical protein